MSYELPVLGDRVRIFVNGEEFIGTITAFDESMTQVKWDTDVVGWYLATHLEIMDVEP